MRLKLNAPLSKGVQWSGRRKGLQRNEAWIMVQFLSKVPPLILIGSGILIIWFVYMLLRMKREAMGLLGHFDRLSAAWTNIKPLNRDGRVFGLDNRTVDGMRLQFGSLKSLAAEWWGKVEECIERYTSPEDREGWFVTKPIREILTADEVVGSNYHGPLYGSFPGILTGVGLMLTFLAILIALHDVHYDKANLAEPVSGIDLLINGLSGKFLSSIVALALSVVFTLFEKNQTRTLRLRYDVLVSEGAARFPYLSQSRILLDIQRFASKQTVSVSHISSEVVDRFVGAFRNDISPALAEGVSTGMAGKLQDEFRPTMERMNATLEQLSAAIVRLEAQKQESVTSELAGLLRSLETSLVQALSQMGSEFRTALSGSAKEEFSNVQGTLEATRSMLSDMNGIFTAMQAEFARIIQKAEESTSSQLVSSRQQTEAQTALMEGLMIRLQQTAEQNVSGIRNQLGTVVSDLAQKVGEVSRELMLSAHKVAQESQASANDVVEKAGGWSEATARRLDSLMESIEARSSEFALAGQTLLKFQESLKATIVENQKALSQMADASNKVKMYSEGLAGQIGGLKTLSENQIRVTVLLKEASANMDTTFQKHGQFLQQYHQLFKNYEGTFENLDSRIAKIMGSVNQGMQQYTQQVERNFREIVKTANEMLPDIVKKLDAQTEGVAEQLEELGDVIATGLEKLNGGKR
jgi:hypothetical protein